MTHYFLQRLQVRLLAFLFFTLVTFASCIDAKKAIYFNNVQDTSFTSLGEDYQPVIQKNDLLSITVTSLNPEATLIFNTPNVGVSPASNSAAGVSAAGSNQSPGYLVTQEGNILFPLLGTIPAVGFTKKQLTDKIAQTLVDKKLLIDPIVNIRFLNFRVTVLGEVARPTVINVANEKISVLEALGLAGDLTIYAKRENVLLIREENGKKLTKRLNLNSSEMLSSPYYYLKTNDIVYAEPNEARLSANSTTRQNLPIVLSALSFITIIFTYVLRK
jgi:polysaccharide export outer membrane protein